MAYEKVCADADVPVGGMTAFFIDDWEILLVRDKQGELHAMDGTCPHEDFPLVEGSFDGSVITCAGHKWMFDATTGAGISPPGCHVDQCAVKVEDGEIYIDREAKPEA